MERIPSSVESLESKKKEGWAFRTMRNFVLGSMLTLGAGGAGGEMIREVVSPGFEKMEMTDNWNEAKRDPEETIKHFLTLRSGNNVYRTIIDSGIKRKDTTGGGGSMGKMPLMGLLDLEKFTDITSYVENGETGEKFAVKLVPKVEGVKMTSQVLDKQGRVITEEVSWLTPDKPNVLEER